MSDPPHALRASTTRIGHTGSMLTTLRVRGLALLQEVRLELEPGFNVLTGETGAGKSLVVDGLCLVRGGKASRHSVRAGADEAQVEAEFLLESAEAEPLSRLLVEHGLPPIERRRLTIQRSVPRAGRSRCLLQGQPTSLALLARIGAELCEITSQHAHQSATTPARQLTLLDTFAELGGLVNEYCGAYRELVRVRADARALAGRREQRRLRAALVRHQLAELDRLGARPGEVGELSERVSLLKNARRYSDLALEARHVLVDDDASTLPRVGLLARRLERAGRGSTAVSALCDALEQVAQAVDSAARSAEALLRAVELQPGELESAVQRLEELASTAAKHGTHADELMQVRERLASELGESERCDQAWLGATEREQRLQACCRSLAERLHDARAAAAPELAARLSSELAFLCMPEARVELGVERLNELGPTGATRIRMTLAANPGEPPGPLDAVASGGELSRLLLALRSVVSRRGPSSVFDEVDAGVGGRSAEAIGLRLAAVASQHQVLCITHLPQIAAFADAHFRVSKQIEGGRSCARVERLEPAERVAELARMLGGSEPSARAHARALLAARAEDARSRHSHIGLHTSPGRSQSRLATG
jgi:DNA repair protein RecN (Recombination protein N)